MSWRPDKWDAEKLLEAIGQSCPNSEMIGDFEAGADAMLEALRHHHWDGTMTVMPSNKTGFWVFIPKEDNDRA